LYIVKSNGTACPASSPAGSTLPTARRTARPTSRQDPAPLRGRRPRDHRRRQDARLRPQALLTSPSARPRPTR
jgi:hypothetical protein